MGVSHEVAVIRRLGIIMQRLVWEGGLDSKVGHSVSG